MRGIARAFPGRLGRSDRTLVSRGQLLEERRLFQEVLDAQMKILRVQNVHELAAFLDEVRNYGTDQTRAQDYAHDEYQHNGPDAGDFLAHEKLDDRVEDVGENQSQRDWQQHGGKTRQ